jgi:hypothetical protein
MKKKFRVFVGYFQSSVNKKVLVGILKKNYPDMRSIDLYECVRGEAGKAYCYKLTFDSKVSLEQAAESFRQFNIKGRRLVVREWVERTGVDERRNVNWRKTPDFNGEFRRKKDRRRFRVPETLSVKT